MERHERLRLPSSAHPTRPVHMATTSSTQIHSCTVAYATANDTTKPRGGRVQMRPTERQWCCIWEYHRILPHEAGYFIHRPSVSLGYHFPYQLTTLSSQSGVGSVRCPPPLTRCPQSATLQASSRSHFPHDTLHKQPWRAALIASVG